MYLLYAYLIVAIISALYTTVWGWKTFVRPKYTNKVPARSILTIGIGGIFAGSIWPVRLPFILYNDIRWNIEKKKMAKNQYRSSF